MSHPISQVTKAAFTVEFSDEEEGFHVVLSGNGDMEAAPVLSRYVSVFHGHAQKHKARILRLDLTHLYFLNSSCLKALASLVSLASRLGAAEQYKIVFRIGLPWQQRSILALQSLGRGLVIVEDCTAHTERSA